MMLQALLGAGGSPLPTSLAAGTAVNTTAIGINASLTVTFKSDGSITQTITGTGATLSYTGPSQWANAVGGGIGATVSLRVTPTSGTFTTNPASSYVSLGSDCAVIIGPTTAGKMTVGTLEFSLDGGSSAALTSAGWSWQLDKI